ncbi:MAG: hypothetical protein ACYC1M_01775 [Armatimonadota bacterium]
MQYFGYLLYILGIAVLIMLAIQSVQMVKRLQKRISDYNKNERDEVERNPYQALADLEAERDEEDIKKKR